MLSFWGLLGLVDLKMYTCWSLMYLVFTRMPSESYRRRLRSLRSVFVTSFDRYLTAFYLDLVQSDYLAGSVWNLSVTYQALFFF